MARGYAPCPLFRRPLAGTYGGKHPIVAGQRPANSQHGAQPRAMDATLNNFLVFACLRKSKPEQS
jgi:hypothetical protein